MMTSTSQLSLDWISLAMTLMILITLFSSRIRKAIVASIKDVTIIVLITYAIGMSITFLCPRCYLSQVQDLYPQAKAAFPIPVLVSMTVAVACSVLITRYLCTGGQSPIVMHLVWESNSMDSLLRMICLIACGRILSENFLVVFRES